MDKLTDPVKSTCLNCTTNSKSPPGGATKCSTTFSWMWDCSGITNADEKKKCEHCNRTLVFRHLVDLATLVIPFGATYGEWLGGVTDPDLNAVIKAFIGTLVADIVYEESYDNEEGYKKKQLIPYVLLDSLAVAGWVLAAQIIQDFVFHGSPNRVIAAAVAGLANYYRTAGHSPIKLDSEQIGGFVIFATAMAGFAGNWSMMGDNLLSRFMSTTFAGFFSFFSAINGYTYRNCVVELQLFPSPAIMSALQLGIVSSLAGVIVDSAFGKPVVSGLAAGAAALMMARSLFNNPSNFGRCGKVK